MKHSWKAPHWLQRLSYQVLPSRRNTASLLANLHGVALDTGQTHTHIASLIESEAPFLVGRPGGTESEGMAFFLRCRLNSQRKQPRPYSPRFRHLVKLGPGVIHHSDSDLDYFHLKYLQATLASDLIGYGLFAPGALGIAQSLQRIGQPVTPIENLEPFVALAYTIRPWTHALSGRRVLVIHPFEKSITHQFTSRKKITGVADILPDFSLEVITPPVTFAGEESELPWHEHFASLTRRVTSAEFDVALIGAGSYGLPIGHTIKEMGKQAIHIGGSLQLLFGIAGRRWDNTEPFRKYVDTSWTRPSAEEVPAGHVSVEKGAYW